MLLMGGNAQKVKLWWTQPLCCRLSVNSCWFWMQATMCFALAQDERREEKSALSCCLCVGTSTLITEMHSLFRPAWKLCQSPHCVASEENDRLDKPTGWSCIMIPAPLEQRATHTWTKIKTAAIIGNWPSVYVLCSTSRFPPSYYILPFSSGFAIILTQIPSLLKENAIHQWKMWFV